MIDTHSHLNFRAFAKDVSSVVRRYLEEGGEELMVVGAKQDSSEKAVKIAREYKKVYATVGIHPHHLDAFNNSSLTENWLLMLGQKEKVVAIGETGIDYYQYKNYPPVTPEQKERQRKLFLLHLKTAYQLQLPVIIHVREAQNDILTIIKSFIKKHPLTGVFHCFSGDLNYLQEVISLGFYLGFDGNITYSGSSKLQELVGATPLSRLLVETDSPYLTPEPFRGKRNEPAFLRLTIEKIAQIKKTSCQKIEKQTSLNARLLFRFS